MTTHRTLALKRTSHRAALCESHRLAPFQARSMPAWNGCCDLANKPGVQGLLVSASSIVATIIFRVSPCIS